MCRLARSYAVDVQGRGLLSNVRYIVELDLISNRSRTTVEFDCNTPGSDAYIDLAVVALESASLNGAGVADSAWQDGRLQLTQLNSSNNLEVAAAVSHAETDQRGLACFLDDGGEQFVYTYGRTDGVARWAPCFLDVPAIWDLRVVAPDDWTVLSHCPPVRPRDRVWRFLPPYPLPDGPTFAAGPWTRVEGSDGVPLWARPSVAEMLGRTPVGALVASALASHEQVVDVAYPYETRDCVFIPGYGSQAGCSGGLIMFHERVLHASLTDDWMRYVRWVVAHETAHSWFGDLVGFDGDEHRWTAEGIATYLCHRANESWARFHVLEELKAHADSESDATDAPSLIYARPAAVVRHLESIIGPAAVDAGMTAWLREHAGSSSTGHDLVAEWSTAASADLSGWADAWLHSQGVNTLVFDRRANVIRQTGIPLRDHHFTIRSFDDDLVPRCTVEVVATGAETPVPTDLRDAALVVLNTPARTYAKVRLDRRSRTSIAACLGSLDESVRAACWVAAIEMVRDGLMPHAELEQWVTAWASAEPDPEVRELLAVAAAR